MLFYVSFSPRRSTCPYQTRYLSDSAARVLTAIDRRSTNSSLLLKSQNAFLTCHRKREVSRRIIYSSRTANSIISTTIRTSKRRQISIDFQLAPRRRSSRVLRCNKIVSTHIIENTRSQQCSVISHVFYLFFRHFEVIRVHYCRNLQVFLGCCGPLSEIFCLMQNFQCIK